MANIKKKKGAIGILTGGGDVPGLNRQSGPSPSGRCARAYDVIGIRRGWLGLVNLIRDPKADNSENFQILSEEIVNKPGGQVALYTYIPDKSVENEEVRIAGPSEG